MQLTIPDKVMKVIKRIKSSGSNIYVVGGSIRDLLLGEEPKDWDLATNMDLNELSKLFPNRAIIRQEYKVLMLSYMGTDLQIAQLRSEGKYRDGRHPDLIKAGVTLKEDVKRRDFTINGIYYDPINSKIIDHVDGISDLKKRQIKTIGESSVRLSEDYLRILRAIRFAGKLKFNIEKNTFDSILNLSNLTKRISGERVKDEITRMLLSENAFHSIELLVRSKILHNLFSDFLVLPKFSSKFLKDFKSSKRKIENASSTSSAVSWAIFLRCLFLEYYNDKKFPEIIPKKSTIYVQVSDLLKLKLKFNNTERKKILNILQNQQFLIVSNKDENKIWKKTLRFPFIIETLEFFRIMYSSNKGFSEILNFWTEKLKTTRLADLQPKKLIKGNDLIKLGIGKGPDIEKILLTIEEEQLEERIKSKKQAIEFVKKQFIEKK